MLDLISQLSDLDKKRMENYITTHGIMADKFIGLDTFLEDWAKNNKRLFHLLGGNLSIKVPYNYEPSQMEIFREREFIFNKHIHFFHNIARLCSPTLIPFFYQSHFVLDELSDDVKYKKPSSDKELVLPKKMKTIRAIQKLLKYIGANEEVMEEFEQIRIEVSMITNAKTKSNLVLSIHPLDFITMSHNNSGWRSCFSWVNGEFQVSSVEMMNSNNVLIAYLENTKDIFNFSTEKHKGTGEEWEWNNKRWRSMVVFTNEIILAGKGYPYINDNLSKFIVSVVRDLAGKNLNRYYQYGVEEYQDCKHIYSRNGVENQQFWRHVSPRKKNIIFTTEGAYNDIINNHSNDLKWWCVRNKVKKNTIISLSGKSKCLCCGKPSLEISGDWEAGWTNEVSQKYMNTDDLVCPECMDYFRCDKCGEAEPVHGMRRFDGLNLCTYCWETRVRRCCECGNTYFKNNFSENSVRLRIKRKTINEKMEPYYHIEAHICPDCIAPLLEKGFLYQGREETIWSGILNRIYSTEIYNSDEDPVVIKYTSGEVE